MMDETTLIKRPVFKWKIIYVGRRGNYESFNESFRRLVRRVLFVRETGGPKILWDFFLFIGI